jgi:F-box/leucine-rich repeat protein 14
VKKIRLLSAIVWGCILTANWSAPSTAAEPQVADALKRIAELGGKVAYDDAKNVVGIDLAKRAATNADLKLLKLFPKLTSLEVWGAEINDVGMDALSGMTGLTALNLENTAITDAGLAKLKPLVKLEIIGLRRCSNLTDAGLAALESMPNLWRVELLYTRIGDAGLAHLKNHAKLKLLDVRGCERVSDVGLAHIKDSTTIKALKLRNQTALTDAGLALLSGMNSTWKTRPA